MIACCTTEEPPSDVLLFTITLIRGVKAMGVAVISRPGVEEKLDILTADARYDLACACSTKDPVEHRHRGAGGRWVYPVTLPNGGRSAIFKTLVSNMCSSDCKYCPLRAGRDVRRCSLSIDETSRVFLDYYNQRKVFGLFLSSGLCGNADVAMARLNGIAEVLRNRHGFKGYIHLKVLPGASDSAIERAVSLASAVSLNIETAGAKNLARLSSSKDYIRDIIEPIRLISRLTGKGMKYSRVKQTTQFIVGAAGETDAEIVRYMGGLYARLGLNRIYFSAYQHGLGADDLPAEQGPIPSADDVFVREHRLYQVDFLLRKYGFSDSEIPFEADGRLSLLTDPKQAWARLHPEFFPVNVNRASKEDLLRVPGLGPITAQRILEQRRNGRISRIEDIGKSGKLLSKACQHITFQGASGTTAMTF